MGIYVEYRRDTVDNWSRLNPILKVGEPGLIIDSSNVPQAMKIGDGVTSWNDLPFFNTEPSSSQNIPNILVKRDSQGSFAANVITAQTFLGNTNSAKSFLVTDGVTDSGSITIPGTGEPTGLKIRFINGLQFLGTGAVSFNDSAITNMGSISLTSNTGIKFNDLFGSNVQILPSSIFDSSYSLTLPSSAPAANQLLQSDSAGNLGWFDPKLSNLEDVSLGTLANKDILQYNGTSWVNKVTGNLTSADLTISGGTGAVIGSGASLSLNTVPISKGGTGSTSFTAGSVVFAGSSTLTQDNANLFWDATNKSLTVGPARIHNVGTNSFFAGSNAGSLTNTGTNQVGIGPGALSGASSNSGYSVAVGVNALNTGGTGVNTAIGDSVMSNAAFAGYNNTAVGAGAMKNAIGSNLSYNVVVGTNAGPVIDGTNYPNGAWNTLMGDWAGHVLTTGSNNTFIGHFAGGSLLTSTKNTYLGDSAGSASTDGLTNATAIGYNAQVTASNALILGGTGSNAVSVGIGITAPSATLDVNGSARVRNLSTGFVRTDSSGNLTSSPLSLTDVPTATPFSYLTQSLQSIALSKFQDVVINGNYAYVSGNYPATVSIYDISAPTAPVLKTTITNIQGTYRVFISGNYMYVPSNGSSTLYIYNISTPTSPTLAGSLTISGSPGSLYNCVVSGNYCYIATQNKGLTVVDVTNPASPTQVYQEGGTTNKSYGIALINSTTLITTNYTAATPWTYRQFKVWNISTPTAPTLSANLTLPANTKPNGVTVVGNYAYVTDTNQMLIHVVNITTPSSPTWVSSFAVSGTFNAAFVAQWSGKYLYVPSGSNATYGGFIDMFDVSNPAAPFKIGTATSNIATSVFGGIAIKGSYIFVGDYGVAPGSSSALTVFTLATESQILGTLTAGTVATNNLTVAQPLILPADPTVALGAATKQYVDNSISTNAANTTLSNLGTTAINADLVPNAANTINLGSGTYPYANARVYTYAVYSTGNVYSGNLSANATGMGILAATNFNVAVQAQGPGKTASLTTGVQTGSNSSGDVYVTTGSAISGNSGTIHLNTGTSTSGTRGNIILNGASIDASSTNIINVANPVNAQDAATKNYVDTSISSSSGLVNTTLVTSSSYTVGSTDYYVGVNYAGAVSITLGTATNGKQLVIKDESGNCSTNAITLVGNVDGNATGAVLSINYGALHLVYRSGWRII
jgi:hypothetical protein